MTATPTSPAASQQAAVDAALLILERMGPVPQRPDRPSPPEPGAHTDRRRRRSGNWWGTSRRRRCPGAAPAAGAAPPRT
jgi:hypothetical protein